MTAGEGAAVAGSFTQFRRSMMVAARSTGRRLGASPRGGWSTSRMGPSSLAAAMAIRPIRPPFLLCRKRANTWPRPP